MAETAHDSHSSFIKTPRQLIVVILLAFLIPIIGIIMLVQLVTSVPSADPGALAPEKVAERLQPVGRVEFGAPAPQQAAQPAAAPQVAQAAPAAPAQKSAAAPAQKPAATGADGKAVYDKACTVCHAAGVAGAPKLGDKAAWGPRLQQGMDTLVQSAVKGKGAMPPKGGNMTLSDAEVRAAVEFMVSQSK